LLNLRAPRQPLLSPVLNPAIVTTATHLPPTPSPLSDRTCLAHTKPSPFFYQNKPHSKCLAVASLAARPLAPRTPNPVLPKPVSRSLLAVSIVFCERATMLSVSVLVHPCIWLPSSSIWLPKSSSWLATLLVITRKHASSPAICSWPSETMRS
ncbi:hypothetical protein TPAR_02897, partial [Tolypocladium paradoxum]